MFRIVILSFTFSLFQSVFAFEVIDNSNSNIYFMANGGVANCPKFVDENTSELDMMKSVSNSMSESLWENEKWSDYKTDKCLDEIDNQGVTTKLFRCKDGTIVHEQPDSTGIGGWNGYCGETAMANINYMYCNYITSPKNYCSTKTTDYTPGTRPGVLTSVMNDYFEDNENCPEGEWIDYYDSSTPEQYISYLIGGIQDGGITTRKVNSTTTKKVSPFPILLDSFPVGGSDRHWVTVVDVQGFEGTDVDLTEQSACKVVVNHWDSQYEVPCHRLAAAAEASGNGAVGLVTGSYPRVKFVSAD